MKTKILAISMVALMMLSGLFVLAGSEGNDAATWEPNGSGNIYSYTLHYDSAEMANTAAQELQLTVADMTPISHAVGTTTLSSVANEGSWGFDTTTGIGPFNSFYAAFDMTDGNATYAILNPYDLAETIDGVDISSTFSNYNVMWVLPTVYWIVENNGDLTLTNDSTSGGVAYAHTINGQIYNYLAIGVYEGSTKTVGGNTVLTSQSGVAPADSISRADYRTYADNYTMSSSLGTNSYAMVWNFYQWELYKYCAYMVMEGFNAQTIVGNGNLSDEHSTKVNSGQLNLYPYAGNPGSNVSSYKSSVKLFIENAWGNSIDIVDGIVSYEDKLYFDSKSTPDDSMVISDYVKEVQITNVNNDFPGLISTVIDVWGLGSGSTGSPSTATTDAVYLTNANAAKAITVGGAVSTNTSTYSLNSNGISNLSNNNGVDAIITGAARLAFVFNQLFPTTTISFSTVDADTYNGSLSGNSIANVPIGSTITVSGNTVTIDDTTITATTQADTAQYDYGVTWSVNDGDTVTADMVITATFTRTVNNYAVSVTADPVGYGTVSAASFPSVPYGSTVTIGDSSITINGDTITATPETDTSEYDYGFDGFYIGDTKLVGGEEITGATSVTAKFTRTNLYTVIIQSSDIDMGTVSPTTITEVPEGTQISSSGNTLSVGSDTVTATPADGYRVSSWNIPSDTVTGDITITANFEIIPTDEQVLMSFIPLIIIFAIIMLAASALMTFRGDGFDMVKLIIGLTICVIVTVTVLLPAAGIV